MRTTNIYMKELFWKYDVIARFLCYDVVVLTSPCGP